MSKDDSNTNNSLEEERLIDKLGITFAMFDYARIQGSIYGFKRFKYVQLLAQKYIICKNGDTVYNIGYDELIKLIKHKKSQFGYLSCMLCGNALRVKGKSLANGINPILNMIGSQLSDDGISLIDECYDIYTIGLDDRSFAYKLSPAISNLNNIARIINEKLLDANQYIDPLYEIGIYYKFYHAYYSWLIKEYTYSNKFNNIPLITRYKVFEQYIDNTIQKLRNVIEVSESEMNDVIQGKYDIKDITCTMIECPNKYFSTNETFKKLVTKIPKMKFLPKYKNDTIVFKYCVSTKDVEARIRRIGRRIFTVDDNWSIKKGLKNFLQLVCEVYKDSHFTSNFSTLVDNNETPLCDSICKVSRSLKIINRKNNGRRKGMIETKDDHQVSKVKEDTHYDSSNMLYSKRYYLTLMINADQIETNNVQYSAIVRDNCDNIVVFGILNAIIYIDRLIVTYWNMDVDNDTINSIVNDMVDNYYQSSSEDREEFTVSSNVIFKSYKQQITKIIYNRFEKHITGGDTYSSKNC